eukprot:365391-Chlamydomonas_euryale.AAC.11
MRRCGHGGAPPPDSCPPFQALTYEVAVGAAQHVVEQNSVARLGWVAPARRQLLYLDPRAPRSERPARRCPKVAPGRRSGAATLEAAVPRRRAAARRAARPMRPLPTRRQAAYHATRHAQLPMTRHARGATRGHPSGPMTPARARTRAAAPPAAAAGGDASHQGRACG